MNLLWLAGCSVLAEIMFQIDKNTAFTKVEENRENAESLSKGVIFHEKSKILLSEKFIPVEFLIPFPKYNFTMKAELRKLLRDLKNMWQQPTYNCPLNISSNFQSNTTDFNVDWILRKIENEVAIARTEVSYLHNETQHFLEALKNTVPNRKKRAAPVVLAGLAAIGLFGGGIAFGSSGSCGIIGVLGGCHDKAKKNAENIQKLADYTEQIATYVSLVKSETDDKFFLISNELATLHKIQNELIENQNRNWEIIQKQFKVFEKNIRLLQDCDQLLFSNQQINFNFDTAASLLNMIYSDVKSYRAALTGYRMNLLNSIPTLLQKRLPMSLVPRDSLMKILDYVAREQMNARDRLTLAIPMDDLLSYYNAELLTDALSIKEGLLLTLAIPLASRQTVFTVFTAKIVPMPQKDTGSAIRWKLEAPYLAVSEDSMETAVLSKDQLGKCLGSSNYRICHETIPTELGHSSCLATLFFGTTMDALVTCPTENVVLPVIEAAENLGYGIWVILSATDTFTMRESSMDSSNALQVRTYPGCQICIITLECGKQITTPHLKIRSDLGSCHKIPATKIQVELSEVERLVPNFMKVGKQKVPVKPMVVVDRTHFRKIAGERDKWEKCAHVVMKKSKSENSLRAPDNEREEELTERRKSLCSVYTKGDSINDFEEVNV